MSRPTVVELNYPEFRKALEIAVATGTRIVPREKERWERYVAQNKVREVNFQAYARGRYENLEAVIIEDSTGPWGGYYMWSPQDEIVLRWERPGEAAQA